jgi:branched-chain amino acid transport system substrate-binding protein
VVKHVTYETTDPDGRQPGDPAQGLRRQRLLQHLDPKFAAQSMRKAGDSAGSRSIYLNNVSSSVASAMKPAGFENVQGVLTAQYLMDPTDKQWDDHPDMKRGWNG